MQGLKHEHEMWSGGKIGWFQEYGSQKYEYVPIMAECGFDLCTYELQQGSVHYSLML